MEPLRIGELSRRVGVTPELLRAWETRYGLLRPTRTGGGYRLYDAGDVRRVRAVQDLRRRGVALAEAVGMVLEAEGGNGHDEPAGEPFGASREALAAEAAELAAALDGFDESGAHAVLDRLLARFSLETVLRDVVLPRLREIGRLWELGRRSIAQEHFATGVIEGRLQALARGWDAGSGPGTVLACPPGERHTIGLLAHGLALRERGWRITWLGAEAPLGEVDAVAGELESDAVVLSAVRGEVVAYAERELRRLAGRRRVLVGGEAARTPLVAAAGCAPLLDDPVTAAAAMARA